MVDGKRIRTLEVLKIIDEDIESVANGECDEVEAYDRIIEKITALEDKTE